MYKPLPGVGSYTKTGYYYPDLGQCFAWEIRKLIRLAKKDKKIILPKHPYSYLSSQVRHEKNKAWTRSKAWYIKAHLPVPRNC